MTNEEIQRTMEFIIKQQEGFSERMEVLSESHAKSEGRITRLEGAFVNLYNTVSKLADTAAKHEKALATLTESQAHTDERLNNLIDVVERLISEGRNGGPDRKKRRK
jgi:chromosome segregation ATPase